MKQSPTTDARSDQAGSSSEIAREEKRLLPPEERIRRLKKLEGIGECLVGPQTVEEIDARIREFRGDE